MSSRPSDLAAGFQWLRLHSRDGPNKIVRYDVRQRCLRVIANLPSQNTVTPGLSPDSKQIALVRIERTKSRQTAQVLVLNQGGEVIHESEVFPFGDGNTELKDTELRPGRSSGRLGGTTC